MPCNGGLLGGNNCFGSMFIKVTVAIKVPGAVWDCLEAMISVGLWVARILLLSRCYVVKDCLDATITFGKYAL